MADDRQFDPEEILDVLERYEVRYVLIGGLAATLYGSPHVTTDVDITPDANEANLERLASALEDLDARVRAPGEPYGAAFDRSSEMLASVSLLNLTTRAGELDVAFAPHGTRGYPDLSRRAVEIEIHGIRVPVAALADVVRSKEAAGREKDRLTLPTLRRLLDRLESSER